MNNIDLTEKLTMESPDTRIVFSNLTAYIDAEDGVYVRAMVKKPKKKVKIKCVFIDQNEKIRLSLSEEIQPEVEMTDINMFAWFTKRFFVADDISKIMILTTLFGETGDQESENSSRATEDKTTETETRILDDLKKQFLIERQKITKRYEKVYRLLELLGLVAFGTLAIIGIEMDNQRTGMMFLILSFFSRYLIDFQEYLVDRKEMLQKDLLYDKYEEKKSELYRGK